MSMKFLGRLSAHPTTPAAGVEEIYVLTTDSHIYLQNSVGRFDLTTTIIAGLTEITDHDDDDMFIVADDSDSDALKSIKRANILKLEGSIAGMNPWLEPGGAQTTVWVSPGICRNGDNDGWINFTSNKSVNLATTGAGGLDTGSIAANTWYYIYAIKNLITGATAGLASTSNSSPTMPSGYTKKRRIGTARSDSSSKIRPFYCWGDRCRDYYYFFGAVNILTDGDIDDPGGDNIDILPAVPGTADASYLRVDNHGYSTGQTLVRSVEEYEGWPIDVPANNAVYVWLDHGSDDVNYKVSGAGDEANIDVLGYKETVPLNI